MDPDPDPPDPRVFGPPGSGSGSISQRYGTLKSNIQGASGIDARFFKLSPASTVSPIMAKFSQYTLHSTCYLVLMFICWQD
jgi:hypothetical protein